MQVTIQCFGAFRPFGEQIILSMSENATVSDIRQVLPKRDKKNRYSF